MADAPLGGTDHAYRTFVEGRLIGMRTNRYTWWVHWRELAEFFLPRRYRWLITPNMQSRGAPINQAILDSTGCLAARNLASGLMSGKTSPSRPWFKLRIGKTDSTQTSPTSLWLADCERIMRLIFHDSNFYNCMATFYFDLVIFGTATMLIYEDFENVINCYNPCAGEYYVDLDGRYRPCILYREFTMTIAAVVDEFGYANCSDNVKQAYDQPSGVAWTREIVVAHALEPNDDGRNFGIPDSFKYREAYWEWQGSQAQQTGSVAKAPGFLRRQGFHSQPNVTVRWDLVSNDPYGRSPAMDGLPDQKQLQLEQRRKAQGIDKMVNPPLVADVQLKNQPASLLPGGMTYVSGYTASGKPGISSVYDTKFPVNEVREDIDEVHDRLRKTFFNDLFQTASQFETRSNITAVEWDMRKSESLVMLGPVFERIDHEGLEVIVERVWDIASRAGIFAPPPEEIAGKNIDVEFVSMLSLTQSSTEAAGIERLMGMAGNLAAVDPAVMDNIDIDFVVDKYSTLMNNDPRIIRSPEQLAQIRQMRQQQQEAQQKAEMAEKMAAGAKTLSETQVGGGENALQLMLNGPQ